MSPDLHRVAWGLFLAVGFISTADTEAAEPPVLFANVRVFNGVDEVLTAGHVLVVGNKIARVSQAAIRPPP